MNVNQSQMVHFLKFQLVFNWKINIFTIIVLFSLHFKINVIILQFQLLYPIHGKFSKYVIIWQHYGFQKESLSISATRT